ncbi:hypothetical protein EV175_005475 [Coemansia sp. RSA 1933]|nr:hypothetical protein EV175_005475 [Coemansia sp. RSA 1933]
MSPQSRKRYQSRISSARLRERQRQRILQAESDIAKLEKHVETLEALVGSSSSYKTSSHAKTPISPSSNSSSSVLAINQSLGRAIDSLEGCVDRIETLRCRIGQRVEVIERLAADEPKSSRHSISFLMCDDDDESEPEGPN